MPQATILIAEDDVNLSDILKTKLSALGHNVLVAHDGEEAEKFIVDQKPDLSLLDIMMPKKSGLDVLETVAQKPETKDLAMMMLSNLAQKKDIDRAQTIGAKEYIVKANTSLAEIVQKLDAFLKANPPKPRPQAAEKKPESPAAPAATQAPSPPAEAPQITNGNGNGTHPAQPFVPVQTAPAPQSLQPMVSPQAIPMLQKPPMVLSQPVPQVLPPQPGIQYQLQPTIFYPVIGIVPAPNQPPQYYYLVPLQNYPPPPPTGNLPFQ